jgi:ribosomal protein L36
VHEQCEVLAKPYIDGEYPNVKLLPVWHGTRPEMLDSIFTIGYESLAITDSGFYGKGLYGTYEAEYAYRVYSQGALILNWAACYSAYPVIDGDMNNLKEKGNYQNYDAHFIPVTPANPKDPNPMVYFPCKPNQAHTYNELVVFKDTQCLPRYLVALQKINLQSPILFNLAASDKGKEEIPSHQPTKALTKPQNEFNQGQSFWSPIPTFQKLPSEEEQVKAKSQSVAHQVNPQDAQALAKWVSDGHLIEVDKLLRKNNNLAHVIISITDRSDRTFNCTGFQYAVWALDFEMCEVFRKYLDNPNAALQIKALEKEPGKYSVHGAHYDMTSLIEKTQIYVNNYYSWDSNQCGQYWQKEVGGEQRKCPAWLIYAWREEGEHVAWVKKDFVNCKVIRRYDKNWLDWWFTYGINGGKGVGSSWAVYRGRMIGCACVTQQVMPFLIREDSECVQHLYGMTNESLKKLTADLNQSLGHPALTLLQQPILPKATGGFWSLPSPNPMLQSEVEQIRIKSQSIANQVNKKDAQTLAKWVSDGNLIEVEKLLRKDKNLAHVIIIITDRSDRTFNCTGFQYAVWALDFEMCEVFKKYLNNPNAALQIKALEKEPEKYSQHGAHYDMTGLVEKVQIYVNNHNSWDYDTCCQYWQKKVGGEQRKCPPWLVYAWSEEGEDVAWVKKDFVNCKVIRRYDKDWLDWWFAHENNGGRGVGSTWAAARGGYADVARWQHNGSYVLDEAVYDARVVQYLNGITNEALKKLTAEVNRNLENLTPTSGFK